MRNNNSMPIKSRGAIFPRQKRTDNSPDYGGDVVLTGEVINHILSEMNRNARDVTIQLSGWKRQDRNGQAYVSLIADIPQDRSQRDPQQGARSAPAQRYGQGQAQQRQGGGGYAQARGGGHAINGPRVVDGPPQWNRQQPNLPMDQGQDDTPPWDR